MKFLFVISEFVSDVCKYWLGGRSVGTHMWTLPAFRLSYFLCFFTSGEFSLKAPITTAKWGGWLLIGRVLRGWGLSSWCLVIVVWLFLAVPWVCLRFAIVVFPDHTHLLFLNLTGGTALCACARHFSLCLVLVQPRKTSWHGRKKC